MAALCAFALVMWTAGIWLIATGLAHREFIRSMRPILEQEEKRRRALAAYGKGEVVQ
jgi:hypothetical protein